MAAAKYVQGVGGAEEDSSDTVRHRAEASRRCVRNLQQYPVMSAEWLALVDSLEQLSRMAQLELMMPQNMKVTESQGRDNESEGTLWDQEQHENAIRILVEEAKVNLCVRMMTEYKKWHYKSLADDKTAELDRKCKQFEESLGLLLRRSFIHLETLQLTDVRLLLEHCALVLERCNGLSLDAGANTKMQETMVLYYFSSVTKHAESLNNSELLAKMRELRLVRLVAEHTLKNVSKYPLEVAGVVSAAFASLAENEDFQTDWESFFVGDDAELFLQFEARVVAPVMAEDAAAKRQLRPLLDFFKIVGRSR